MSDSASEGEGQAFGWGWVWIFVLGARVENTGIATQVSVCPHSGHPTRILSNYEVS